MPGLEAALLGLASAAVNSAIKLWMGDKTLAADLTTKAIDQASTSLTSLIQRRKLERVADQMIEIVTSRTQPLVETEFRNLRENDRDAAILAVQATFEQARLTNDDLFRADLDAVYLDRYLRSQGAGASDDLPDDATRLYDLLLRECSGYAIELAKTLPPFAPAALVEILRRETEIIDELRRIIESTPPRQSARDFEYEYRQLIARVLDVVEMFGATFSEASRRYSLSVAYISLTTVTKTNPVEHQGRISLVAGERVENLLEESTRIFLRGQAGLGKTTLLQWIAVRCARSDFPPGLAHWSELVPFFIPLRRYVNERLPSAGDFATVIGSHIADEMPVGWVQNKLRSGKGAILIDGVDELPMNRRDEVRRWLTELINAFPRSHYIVTSRPAAAEATWLTPLEFTEAELGPMSPSNIATFVGRWFEALRKESATYTGSHELAQLESGLLQLMAGRQHLRRLAGYPLLCSLICALYRDRHATLPESRMELYDIALQMLLERRDAERKISTDVAITRTAKAILLSDLAYWLIKNGASDAPTPQVVGRIARKTDAMTIRASADVVYRHLLERTGLLREPAYGRTDFVHRTFQDYLAAKAAVDDDDDGLLLANAHLDNWHEVVVMACGHFGRERREKLLKGLLKKAKKSPRWRATLYLLAAACLETSTELTSELRMEIQARVQRMLPPSSLEQAKALAVGPFVLDLLAASLPKTEVEAAATIRVATEIGGEEALPVVAQFAARTEPLVRRELIAAWARFDHNEYAKAVISNMELSTLTVRDPGLVDSLRFLRGVHDLACTLPPNSKLDFVPASVQTMELDFEGVLELNQLRAPSLSQLHIRGVKRDGSDAAFVSSFDRLPKLRSLIVEACSLEARGVSYTSGPSSLEFRELPGRSLGSSGPATVIQRLQVSSCQLLGSLSGLEHIAGVEELTLSNCRNLIDLSVLPRWTFTLRKATITNCAALGSLRIFGALKSLEHLEITVDEPDANWQKLQRGSFLLASLAPLDHPLNISLVGFSVSDLDPLNDLGMVSSVTPFEGGIAFRARLVPATHIPKQRTAEHSDPLYPKVISRRDLEGGDFGWTLNPRAPRRQEGAD